MSIKIKIVLLHTSIFLAIWDELCRSRLTELLYIATGMYAQLDIHKNSHFDLSRTNLSALLWSWKYLYHEFSRKQSHVGGKVVEWLFAIRLGVQCFSNYVFIYSNFLKNTFEIWSKNESPSQIKFPNYALFNFQCL